MGEPTSPGQIVYSGTYARLVLFAPFVQTPPPSFCHVYETVSTTEQEVPQGWTFQLVGSPPVTVNICPSCKVPLIERVPVKIGPTAAAGLAPNSSRTRAMIKNAATKISAPAGNLGFEASVVLSVDSFTLAGFVGTGAICGVMVFLLCCC
jgi:hypothetical protein